MRGSTRVDFDGKMKKMVIPGVAYQRGSFTAYDIRYGAESAYHGQLN
jgi:hypothetical protein